MFFDLKSYLIGKHGGAYTPSADLPSYLLGKSASGKIQEITGTLPLAVRSRASQVLKNYRIYGASGGVGDKTVNLFDKSNVEQGCYYATNGVRVQNENHNESDYIPVEAGKTYTFYLKRTKTGYGTFVNLYDVSRSFYKNIYDLINGAGYRNFTPDIDGYIRFNETPSYATDYMFYEGSQDKPYIPYGYQLPLTVRTENLWNDDWFDKYVSDNTIKYVHIYVGEGTFTCSTTCPKIPNPIDGYASRFIFFLSGKVDTGVQNDVNGVWNGSPRTVTSSEGYVTLCYRKLETYDVRPWEYETMIVEGSTAPETYIPYYNTETPIYIGDSPLMEGEYVDYEEQKIYKLVNGVLTPTDPPLPFPDIAIPKGEIAIDIEGELKPQATIEGLIKQI